MKSPFSLLYNSTTMLRNFFTTLFSIVIPPRASERTVESLTLDDLLSLQTEEGLPYHDETVRALVWEVKYYGNARAAALAGELLGEEILAIASEELGTPLLIPVPMHKERRHTRGHNQTELLCEAALSHLGTAVEYQPRTLARHAYTTEQQGLERMKRLHNVKDSMRVLDPGVAGRVCIVVDDVATTGATLAEAKRALRAAGARRVHTVALARS
jgi:ComF family protein